MKNVAKCKINDLIVYIIFKILKYNYVYIFFFTFLLFEKVLLTKIFCKVRENVMVIFFLLSLIIY